MKIDCKTLLFIFSYDNVMRKIAFIDIEGTLTPFECWKEIATLVGNEEIEELLKKGIKGEVDWLKSLLRRIELIKGLEENEFLKLREKLTISEEAKEVIKALKEKGFYIVLVSGCFEEVLEEFKHFGDLFITNKAIFENGKFAGISLKFRDKGEIIEGIARDEDFVLAIGDGNNDVPMFKKANLSIAVGRKVQSADYYAKDLKELLEIIKKLKV